MREKASQSKISSANPCRCSASSSGCCAGSKSSATMTVLARSRPICRSQRQQRSCCSSRPASSCFGANTKEPASGIGNSSFRLHHCKKPTSAAASSTQQAIFQPIASPRCILCGSRPRCYHFTAFAAKKQTPFAAPQAEAHYGPGRTACPCCKACKNRWSAGQKSARRASAGCSQRSAWCSRARGVCPARQAGRKVRWTVTSGYA